MRIAICEDEEKMQTDLKGLITTWAKSKETNTEIKCYSTGEDFVSDWSETYFDLAFLDIEMGKLSGLDVAELIRKSDQNMLIVFATNHRQHALKGYDVNAFHFLIKPIQEELLLPVLNKAYSIWESSQNEYLLISSGSEQIKILCRDISSISQYNQMAKVNTNDGVHDYRITMDELEKTLPKYFVRCHRSYLVNLNKVDRILKDDLLLYDGSRVPVSRSNAKQVKDAFARLYTEI